MRKFTWDDIPVMSPKGARLSKVLTLEQLRESIKTGKPIIIEK
jgi:hypothetical protein